MILPTAAALSGFYLAMATGDRIRPEEELEALRALINACLPHRGIVMASPEGPDKAIIQIEVTERLLPDDGRRIVEPRGLALGLTLTLFGGRLYLDDTTSRVRREQGMRRLHYPYIFNKPNHLTLPRVCADADAGQKVEFIDDHRDLRRPNLMKVDDSLRTASAARDAAIKEAMRLHEAAGPEVAKYLPAPRYRAMLGFAFTFFDNAAPGATRVREAAE